MSRYLTRASSIERDYVVIKHGIPNVNGMIMGVRFRDSWAVVERGSKIYHRLKQLPMLKNVTERPLSFLQSLKFINRAADVKMIFGADVYTKYVNMTTKEEKARIEEEEILEEKLHLEDELKCKFRLETGKLCKNTVQDPKISSFCSAHILKDERLKEIGFRIPLAMTQKEKRKTRKTAFNKLRDLIKGAPNDSMVKE